LLDLFGSWSSSSMVLELYRLFKDVDRTQARTHARARGTGIAVQVATQALNLVPLILRRAELPVGVHPSAARALAYGSLRLFGNRGIC